MKSDYLLNLFEANKPLDISDREIFTILKEVEGKKVQGQQVDSPRFHPFPARMPLSLATFLLEHFTAPGDVVLDPMCGSATTLMAAQEAERQGVGIDRDFLACLLSRVATTSYDSAKVEELGNRILDSAKQQFATIELNQARNEWDSEDQEFLKFWFPWRSQKELFAIQQVIQNDLNDTEKDLAWVVFSSLIIAKTTGVSWAIDISRSRPHRKLDLEPARPFEAWLPRFKATVRRLPLLDQTPALPAVVRYGDARELPLQSNSADFVLTSPPYHNAIDYLRSHKFSLIWMGHNLESIRELRGTMVGSERGLYELDGIPEKVEQRLQRVSPNRKQATLRRYLSEMKKVFQEIHRVLKPESVALVVVGPTLMNSTRTDAAEVFGAIADDVGFCMVENIVRTIPNHRRSLPFPSKKNADEPLAQRMNREVILALRKTDSAKEV